MRLTRRGLWSVIASAAAGLKALASGKGGDPPYEHWSVSNDGKKYIFRGLFWTDRPGANVLVQLDGGPWMKPKEAIGRRYNSLAVSWDGSFEPRPKQVSMTFTWK